MENEIADDVKSECTRLETLSDRLEPIRELIESAAHEHHLDTLRQTSKPGSRTSFQAQPSAETCSAHDK